jgi:hypothetical protein
MASSESSAAGRNGNAKRLDMGEGTDEERDGEKCEDLLVYPGLYAPSGFDIMSILVRCSTLLLTCLPYPILSHSLSLSLSPSPSTTPKLTAFSYPTDPSSNPSFPQNKPRQHRLFLRPRPLRYLPPRHTNRVLLRRFFVSDGL